MPSIDANRKIFETIVTWFFYVLAIYKSVIPNVCLMYMYIENDQLNNIEVSDCRIKNIKYIHARTRFKRM